jgi:hypothetical protein
MGGGAVAGYAGLVTGAISVDLGVGRRSRPLGPVSVGIGASRELVFDVIAEPYLGRQTRAVAEKIKVLERGADMVLAAHFTRVHQHLVAQTVETVRFTRPERVDFRLVRGPVPHVVERFTLTDADGGTRLEYQGDLATDLWALGAVGRSGGPPLGAGGRRLVRLDQGRGRTSLVCSALDCRRGPLAGRAELYPIVGGQPVAKRRVRSHAVSASVVILTQRRCARALPANQECHPADTAGIDHAGLPLRFDTEGRVRAERSGAEYRMAESAEVIVVGMGPGGEDAAGNLAEAGLDVLGIEANLVGGECPYWGCVPSKMMIRAANLLAEARRIPGMAGASTVTPDWAPVAKRIREEATDFWNDKIAVDPVHREGRPVPARPSAGRGAAVGRGRRRRIRGHPRAGHRHRHRAGHPGDRRTRRNPLLDQP